MKPSKNEIYKEVLKTVILIVDSIVNPVVNPTAYDMAESQSRGIKCYQNDSRFHATVEVITKKLMSMIGPLYADLEKAQLNEAYAMHDQLCAQAELAEAYEYAKLNGVAALELNLELGKLREKLDWYFECEEVRHWFFVRTDVDCTDYHKDDEHCPWCTPNGEIEMSYQQAKADLRGDDA